MNNDQGLTNAVLYNPRQLNRETMKAIFTARRGLLDRIVQDLRAARPTHQLIVGARGMGKTSLLRRIGIAIEEDTKLAKRLLPLTFPEEQYNVGSLGEFYLNCLDAVADYFDKHNDPTAARKVDDIVQKLRHYPEEKLVDEAEAALVWHAKFLKRQFVLLVDNLSIVIDRFSDKEKWRLREWLSRSDRRPVMIAATVKFISDTADYGQALYEFMHVHELAGCDTEEATSVLRELAKVFKAPQVERWLDADPARLAVLNRLAGGAPRTLVMLFQLLVQGIDGPIFQELDRLLDLATPLYKARFEELPDQSQRVVDALALHWDPATRQDLEGVSRMDGNAISSQLSRLAKMGVVEEVAIPGEAKTAYQIAERFFNIWYLMRASRRSRHQLRWLVEFLKAFYSTEERTRLADKLLHTQGHEPLSHGKRLLAMSQAVEDGNLQRELQNTAMYTFAKADRKCHMEMDLSDIDKDWLKKLDRLSESAEKEEFILNGIMQEPASSYRYCELGAFYEEETEQYLKAEEAYWNAIKADSKDAWAWDDLGELLTTHLNRHTEAEQIFRKAIEADPKNYWPWLHLGDLFANNLGLYMEAEQAYRTAIELDSSGIWSWISLGALLANHLDRPAEAERAFRKAIKLDANFFPAWLSLGELLDGQLDRSADAEQAFRSAIELDPSSPLPLCELAWLLFLQGKRYMEAEALAHRACALKSTLRTCHTLACILAREGKITESLDWIRRAIISKTDELTSGAFAGLSLYFKELVFKNQAELGVRLLEELNRGESWRPLVEALRAAGKRNRDALKRINPEQREAAERTYDFFVKGLPDQEHKD